MREEFKRYAEEIIREVEEQIQRENSIMTEEERIWEEIRREKLCKKIIGIVSEKHL